MRHIIENEWAINGKTGYVDMDPHIFNYITLNKIKPVELKFEDVCFKRLFYKDEHRYNNADVTYPKIVVECENPENKKYRMIDGRHRIHKEIIMGKREGLFYVIPNEVFHKYMVITD